MASKEVEIYPGQKIVIEPFDEDEMDVFDREWPVITKVFSLQAGNLTLADLLRDHFDKYKESYRLMAQQAKYRIDPAPGTFQGIHAENGFGWRPGIMPDLLVPSAQGRTYETAVSGLTVGAWYGLWHNAAIGGAYNATPLYMGKQSSVVISAVLETADVCFEQIQFEFMNKKKVIQNMQNNMYMGDYPLHDLGVIHAFEPAKQYRCQVRAGVAAGTTRLLPVGIEFSDVAILKTEQPTQPTTTAP